MMQHLDTTVILRDRKNIFYFFMYHQNLSIMNETDILKFPIVNWSQD